MPKLKGASLLRVGGGISNRPGAARPGRAVLFFVNKEKNQKKDFLLALRAKPFSAYAYRKISSLRSACKREAQLRAGKFRVLYGSTAYRAVL